MQTKSEMLREKIRTACEENGGHLASSLGAADLILALHNVFDFSKDAIVFDVGHQAYAHKLLTGRDLANLRRQGGVSGFPTRREGDDFGVGHGGTAISAALGIARGKKLAGKEGLAIALVGDGAMNCGQCYEALNDAGAAGLPLLVILNDNEMAISKNVGALSLYLSRLCRRASYVRFKKGVKQAVSKTPRLYGAVSRLKKSIKQLFVESSFFEHLGFAYVGPVDGHDMEALESALAVCRDMGRPVLLHAITQKGFGDARAESDPCSAHSLPVPDAEKTSGWVTSASVIEKALVRLGGENERLCAITAAMPGGTGLSAFAEKYPDRFFDVGIAEAHAVTMAAGMAVAGAKPVVCIYSTFLQRSYDQILHDVALQQANVVLLIDKAGFCGPDGATHQGLFDIAYLRHIPGMTILSPRDALQLEEALSYALALPGPCAIRYGRALPVDCGGQEQTPWPRWPVLKSGGDGVIYATSAMVHTALQVRENLKLQGKLLAVVDARVVKPLDSETIAWAGKRPAVVLEEGSAAGRLGEGIRAKMDELGQSTPFLSLGAGDTFYYHATREQQLARAGLTPGAVAERIARFLQNINMQNS